MVAKRLFIDEYGNLVEICRSLSDNAKSGIGLWELQVGPTAVHYRGRKCIARFILRWRKPGQITGLSIMDVLVGTSGD